jgi:hypothetical protein
MIEIIMSADGRRRVRIFQRQDRMLQVESERLVFSGVEGEPPYWSRTSRSAILTDDLDRAREIAAEELANV